MLALSSNKCTIYYVKKVIIEQVWKINCNFDRDENHQTYTLQVVAAKNVSPRNAQVLLLDV